MVAESRTKTTGSKARIQEAYGQVADRKTRSDPALLARKIGYSSSELDPLPEGSNLGLFCGNPVRLARLQPGEVVLDLGSGAGFDAFIAGREVGPKGRVIGVDMTPAMVDKANTGWEAYEKSTGLYNVEFRLGDIEQLPVDDNSVDVVISNCVMNLCPDKSRVWAEVFRVLRPGGRVAVADLALTRPVPRVLVKAAGLLVGCVAGVVSVSETRRTMEKAGFADVDLRPQVENVELMTEWNDPFYRRVLRWLPRRMKISDLVTSLDVSARKPA